MTLDIFQYILLDNVYYIVPQLLEYNTHFFQIFEPWVRVKLEN